MMQICEATTPDHFAEVCRLMRAFVAWHRERHRVESDLIDRYFDANAFQSEMDGLPGKYAQPRGRLLLAVQGTRPAGCVALRDLGAGACEMKRMFVYPEFHGMGVGRALGRAIIREAKSIGYTVMRLDTGSRQTEAQHLYRSMGFRDTPPYYALPDDLRAWLVFMELDLTAANADSGSETPVARV